MKSLLVAALLAWLAPAFAQSNTLSLSEAQFRSMDINDDNRLSPQEQLAALRRMIELLKPLRENLSAAEHAAAIRLMFERMDTNKDGIVSRVEFMAGHARMLTKAASR